MDWRICIVTFNVNMKQPTAEVVDVLLKQFEQEPPHLLVVGMQEVAHAETIGGAVVTWQRLMRKWAVEKGKMVLLTKNYQATNQITIFVKKRLVAAIRRIDYRFARNTLGGLTGHKGSIGVRIQLQSPFSIVFVGSHFIHDVAANDKRLAQFATNETCSFPEDQSVRARFWLGDLNFRVEKESSEVIQAIGRNDYLKFIDQEQLKLAQRTNDAFIGYEEGKISFPPTYKMIIGSTRHDPKRTPSWTDRILYKGNTIESISYTSNPKCLISDHIPVTAQLRLHLPTNPEAQWKVVFEHVPTWFSSIPLIGRFRTDAHYWSKNGSYRDWVGLFPASIEDCTSATHWVYVATCLTETIAEENFQICEFMQVDVGEYRLGYFSAYLNCLVGLSKSFKVQKQPQE